MNYVLIKDTINLMEQFESEMLKKGKSDCNIQDFKFWVVKSFNQKIASEEPNWEGKDKGRTPESVINTLIIRMNRYAKTYSKSAIHQSDFSTQEEFIYLINLKAFGAMTKIELIKRNIQEKSFGMQVVNRLINMGFVEQQNSAIDKRSKIIAITEKGLQVLEHQMDKIRQATNLVTGNLTHAEKMELIQLLNKLDQFHEPIFLQNMDSSELLDRVKLNVII